MRKKAPAILAVILLFAVVISITQIHFVSAATLHVGSGETYSTIQAAVNAATTGDIVLIHPGTYDEQVIVDRSVTLEGYGDTTIIQPSDSSKLITILSAWWGLGGSKQVAGIIIASVAGGSSVTIRNLKVDGAAVTTKPAGADYVAGILYRETGGLIDRVTVANMTVGTTGTSVRGYGVYLSAKTNAVFIEAKDSTVSNYDKNAIDVHGSKLTVNIHGNVIVGRGSLPSGDEVQNGVLIMDGATGSVNGNTISSIDYAPATWWAGGVTFYNASGSAEENVLSNCQTGVAVNEFKGSWTIIIRDNFISGSNGAAIDIATYDAGSTLNALIEKNNLIGGSGDGIYIGDIPASIPAPAGTITATISENIMINWHDGIHIVSSLTSASIHDNSIQFNLAPDSGIHIESGITVDAIHVNHNNFGGNMGPNVYGLFNEGSGILDAENNWWGSSTGPTHSSNLGGTGDRVSDRIDFTPWLTNEIVPTTTTTVTLTSTTTTTVPTVTTSVSTVTSPTTFVVTSTSTVPTTTYQTTTTITSTLYSPTITATATSTSYVSTVTTPTTTTSTSTIRTTVTNASTTLTGSTTITQTRTTTSQIVSSSYVTESFHTTAWVTTTESVTEPPWITLIAVLVVAFVMVIMVYNVVQRILRASREREQQQRFRQPGIAEPSKPTP